MLVTEKQMIHKTIHTIRKNRFMFEELVKRDFKEKYKRSALGIGWSMLSPLLTLLVMRIVFSSFLGKNVEHYTTYMFCGFLVYNYFSEATKGGMNALTKNAKIFSKINMPKYMFLLSRNVSSLANFGLTLCVFFLFVAIDRVPFSWTFLTIVFPAVCLMVFNIGIGLILSAGCLIFQDVSYLYDVFTRIILYLSAIFYTIEDKFEPQYQRLFLLNPIFVYIKYFRIAVLDQSVPSLFYHALCIGYALLALLLGAYIYKRYNKKFIFYV